MMDDATNILPGSQPPDGDDTRVLPTPPQPAGDGKGRPTRRGVPWWVRLIWALVRLGSIATALLLSAQLSASYLSAPLFQWILALIVALVLPGALYALLRRTVTRRSPKARFRLSILTWTFGWGLMLATLIWINLPGIGTLAVGVQGTNLARGLSSAISPDHMAPRAVAWFAGQGVRAVGKVESLVFGDERTRDRRKQAAEALVSFHGGLEGPDTETPAASPPALSEAQAGLVTGPTLSGAQGDTLPNRPAPATTSVEPAAPVAGAAPLGQADTESRGPSTMPAPLPGTVTETTGAPPPNHRTVVEVPFEQEAGNLLVDVVVNRRYPVRLRIDSTTAYTTIDGKTLKRMGIQPAAGAPTIKMATLAGEQTDVVLVLDTLALGGLEVVGPTIMRCNECRGLTYQGILGNNVLSNFKMRIDKAQGVLLFTDLRDQADRKQDIYPFVTIEAKPQPADGPYQPFVITAESRAERPIRTLFARLTLLDAQMQPIGGQDIKLPPLSAKGKVSKRIDVPRTPPFEYFSVDLGNARW